MYKISRYWNRLAYFFIHLGQRMVWDYTGKNGDLLNEYVANKYAEMIFCDRQLLNRRRNGNTL